jgi:transposase InsO family protein
MTMHPDEEWLLQVARNVTDAEVGFLRGKRYLLMDRDGKFSEMFRETLQAAGVKPVRLPPRSPNLNANIERFMRSLKEECLDRMIFFGEKSLQTATSNYVDHYLRADLPPPQAGEDPSQSPELPGHPCESVSIFGGIL